MVPGSFGKYLAELRLKSGYPMQKDLSIASGVSTATISRIEANKQKPHPDILKKIAPLLGVTCADLLKKAGYIEDAPPLSNDEITRLNEFVNKFKVLSEEEQRDLLRYGEFLYQKASERIKEKESK